MSLRPTRPGEPGFQDWKDLADAVDSVGVLGAGCAEADPHEVEREAFYSSLGAYFLPDGSPRLEGDDDSACAQNRGTNTMNTPEFDFTAEQPNRLFEKWWAEQAEYRHRQTGISEARAIWLCSWRAYGEACRASLASTPAPVLTDERVKSELMDALEIYGRAKLIEGKEDSGSAEEHRSAVAFLSVLECFDRAILAAKGETS